MVEMAKSKFESFKHAMDWTPGFPTKCLEKMSYLGVGVSPGTVPVYHSTNLKLLDKRIKIAELVLRFMILGLGVVTAVLIGTDSQVKVVFSFEKEAKFTAVKALVFLVVANGLATGYSLIQGLRCVVSLVRGSVLFNKPLAWAIFSADQNDHKRGCNCKKSFCQKKYCKCFQAGVGCDTCKNTFGRKRMVLILISSELRKLVPWLPNFLFSWYRIRRELLTNQSLLRNMLCSELEKGKVSLEEVEKRLRRSLKLEFNESDDADIFKDEYASDHGVK